MIYIKKNDSKRFVKMPSIWIMEDDGDLLKKHGNLSYVFYIYCLLHQLKFDNNRCVFSLHGVLSFFDVLKTREMKRRMQNQLINCIRELEQDNIISFYSDIGYLDRTAFNADKNNIFYVELNLDSKKGFFKLYVDEIIKIAKCECEDVNKIGLLSHFSVLMCHINNKSSLAYATLDYISELLSVSHTTCIKNNKILVDLELIYYESAGLLHLDKDFVKSYPNTYARYNNKQLVINFVETQRANYKGRLKNDDKGKQERANRRGGLRRRLNNLDKKRDRIGLTYEEELEYKEKQEEYDVLVAIREKEIEENA